MEGKKWFAYGTRHTLAVTHPVTNRARRCLTSVIGREWLVSTCYGRRHKLEFRSRHMLNFTSGFSLISPRFYTVFFLSFFNQFYFRGFYFYRATLSYSEVQPDTA